MSLELDRVTAETFEPHVGSAFVTAQSATPFILDSITRRGDGPPPRPEGFSLFFRRDADDVLPQKIYDLSHETLGEMSIFLVPIREAGKGVLYEAVFN